MANTGELLSSGALSTKLGISAGALKKLIEAEKIQPDAVKGVCKYYGPAAVKKLQKAAKK